MGNLLSRPSLAVMPLAEIVDAQLLMVAGFVMLGWVLARRQLKLRKRTNRDARAANRAIEKIRAHREPDLPLCDAPAETQRWQVALFDLQRELKAELDTRIAVVQSLTRQVDERIEVLSRLQNQLGVQLPPTPARGLTPQQLLTAKHALAAGADPAEVADGVGISTAELQRMVADHGSQASRAR